MVKLYTVTSVADYLKGCDQVPIQWFVCDRKEAVGPYEELIARPDGETDERWPDEFARDAVDEMFLKPEAEALCQYLRDTGDPTCQAERAELPVPANRMGPGRMPVGGTSGFLMLDRREGYPLAFPVRGYFNTRGCPSSLNVRLGMAEPAREFVAALTERFGLRPVNPQQLDSFLHHLCETRGLQVRLTRRHCLDADGTASFTDWPDPFADEPPA